MSTHRHVLQVHAMDDSVFSCRVTMPSHYWIPIVNVKYHSEKQLPCLTLEFSHKFDMPQQNLSTAPGS